MNVKTTAFLFSLTTAVASAFSKLPVSNQGQCPALGVIDSCDAHQCHFLPVSPFLNVRENHNHSLSSI